MNLPAASTFSGGSRVWQASTGTIQVSFAHHSRYQKVRTRSSNRRASTKLISAWGRRQGLQQTKTFPSRVSLLQALGMVWPLIGGGGGSPHQDRRDASHSGVVAFCRPNPQYTRRLIPVETLAQAGRLRQLEPRIATRIGAARCAAADQRGTG